MAQLQAECVILTDRFSITQVLKSTPAGRAIKLSGGPPEQLTKPFFKDCQAFIDECAAEILPKLGVEATLYYAKIARFYESYCQSSKTNVDRESDYTKKAKELLDKAKKQCEQRIENADGLRSAVEDSIKLVRREWYEVVSAEELAAVKNAMISGSRDIVTHAGHWYNCANGHPVSPSSTYPFSNLLTLL